MDPSIDEAARQVEAAIEQGRLDEARRLVEEAQGRFGQHETLDDLRQRIDEVGSITAQPRVDELIRAAQDAIHRADYAAALAALQEASQLVPQDDTVTLMLAQTEKARRRHKSAVERNQSIADRGRQIEAALARGELAAARDDLRQAGIDLGRHPTLTALEEKLAEAEREDKKRQAREHIDRARARIEESDWRAALAELEHARRLDAENPDISGLSQRARAELEREAGRRHHDEAVSAARRDVERLIAARELPRAAERLREALVTLGGEERFADLQQQLDKARSDLRFRQRVEWAERRANEAESLLAEAARLSLMADYERAIERLTAARELDPSHPDIPSRLQTAQAARERQLAQQRRNQLIDRRAGRVRAHLDALRLDEAAAALAAAQRDFGEIERFAPLATRLVRLREVEGSGGMAGLASDSEVLERQRALAAAYSWKQTLLFPFRGFGTTVFAGLIGLLLALDLLAALPWVGGLFAALRILVPLAALGLLPEIARATLAGKNKLPRTARWLQPRRWGGDLLRFGALALAASSPLLLLLLSRPWHALLESESGPFGWLAAGVLTWLAGAVVVMAVGAAAAFGDRHAFRLRQHAAGLRAAETDALLAIGLLFALLVLVVLLRAILAAAVPWLGLPLLAAVESYTLLAAPHLIGVLVRRHRVELGQIYG